MPEPHTERTAVPGGDEGILGTGVSATDPTDFPSAFAPCSLGNSAPRALPVECGCYSEHTLWPSAVRDLTDKIHGTNRSRWRVSFRCCLPLLFLTNGELLCQRAGSGERP